MSASTKAVLSQAEAAIDALLKWDAARKFPVPYKVRDPLIAAHNSLRAALAEDSKHDALNEATKRLEEMQRRREERAEKRELAEDLEPAAYLVEWKCDKDIWVRAHVSEPPALDEAKRFDGTCTPLYRPPPPAALRAAVIEECAQVAEEWGKQKVDKWCREDGDAGMCSASKVEAWNAHQVAHAIRALNTKEPKS